MAFVPELLLQGFWPAINGILVAFAVFLRRQAQAAASENQRAIGAEKLYALLRGAGVVESGRHVDVESVVCEEGVKRVGHLAPIFPSQDASRRHNALGHLHVHDEMDGRDEVNEKVGGDAAAIIPVLAIAENALGIERTLGS